MVCHSFALEPASLFPGDIFVKECYKLFYKVSRIYPYLSQQLLHTLISHLMLTPPGLSITALFHCALPSIGTQWAPTFCLRIFLSATARVPLVSTFMAHWCHTCCSSPCHGAIPNSARHLHIWIYVAGLADHRMSATVLHQEDGDGKSSKDISNY